MKLRNGFVSNSSSSSFIIVGNPINNVNELTNDKNIIAIGDQLMDGDDIIHISESDEILNYIKNNPEITRIIDIYEIYKMNDDMLYINKDNIPVNNFAVFSINEDNDSTRDISTFIERYNY